MKNKLNKFEFEKYENLAKKKLIDLKQNNLGFENIPLYLMKPYLDYGKTLIKKQSLLVILQKRQLSLKAFIHNLM